MKLFAIAMSILTLYVCLAARSQSSSGFGTASTTTATNYSLKDEMTKLHNIHRANAGLKPYSWDDQLAQQVLTLVKSKCENINAKSANTIETVMMTDSGVTYPPDNASSFGVAKVATREDGGEYIFNQTYANASAEFMISDENSGKIDNCYYNSSAKTTLGESKKRYMDLLAGVLSERNDIMGCFFTNCQNVKISGSSFNNFGFKTPTKYGPDRDVLGCEYGQKGSSASKRPTKIFSNQNFLNLCKNEPKNNWNSCNNTLFTSSANKHRTQQPLSQLPLPKPQQRLQLRNQLQKEKTAKVYQREMRLKLTRK